MMMAANGASYGPSSQGLFSRRSSTNILSDPRILEHLRIVAAEAQLQDCQEEDDSDEENDLEARKRLLAEDIDSYNKRNQYGAFTVTQKDCEYEGALRFYYEQGNQELTKAVRVKSTTTVEELLPLLVDKFNLSRSLKYSLYEVHGKDELYLYGSDQPLDIAIHALKSPRFVLKVKSDTLRFASDPATDRTFPSKKTTPTSSLSSDGGSGSAVDSKFGPHQINASSNASFRSTLTESSYSSNVPSDSNVSQLDSHKSPSKPHATHPKRHLRQGKALYKMLRKKKSGGKQELSTELSTYKLAPGILKVFGDHVSPGSNYKSVRVSTISTSAEVVRQALERYSLEFCNPSDFVLCDVIGHFQVEESKQKSGSQEEQWVTEYVRVINDNEKPLVLQSLWKPATGRSRRYELRRRIDVGSSLFFINTSSNLPKRDSIASNGDDSQEGDPSNPTVGSNSPMPRPSSALNGLNSLRNSTTNSSFDEAEHHLHSTPNRRPSMETPTNCPFLVLLKGYNMHKENVIYLLDDTVLSVGNLPSASENGRPNIVLTAPDISEQYCSFYRKVSYEEASLETNVDDVRFLVFVEPVHSSSICINGIPIAGTTLLQPGQLLAVGKHYVFMFRDATQSSMDSAKLSWLDVLKQRRPTYSSSRSVVSESKGVQVSTLVPEGQSLEVQTASAVPDIDRSTDDDATLSASDSRASSVIGCALKEKSTLQLAYSYEDEDELLRTIVEIVHRSDKMFKLSAGYLLVMMIEHSAATFSELETRRLLLKISSELQGIAWEKTKEIGKQVSNDKSQDAFAHLDMLIPELKPVIYWMGNALEMLHFLQCNLSKYLLPRDQLPISRESLSSADEELLTVLEEVIMFTFQQTVYHLTKILYSALPAILDTNPFQQGGDDDDDDEPQNIVPPSVARIVNIFDSTLKMVQEYCVHPQIIEQLFSYLFFFTNASVLNSLMERGTGGKFYKWTKGVQIRGNLDTLDDWATQSGLQEQFSVYTEKLNAAVSLLSVTKVQLMQMDWTDIRQEYPALNPAQVQQLLGEYHLGGKPRPRGWFPPPEEVEPALRSADVLESFATHPPLLLPTVQFLLDLNNSPEDPLFYECLDFITERFGTKKETHKKKAVFKKRRKRSKGDKTDGNNELKPADEDEDGSVFDRSNDSRERSSSIAKEPLSSDEEPARRSSKHRLPTPIVERRPSDLDPIKRDISIDSNISAHAESQQHATNNNNSNTVDQNTANTVGNPQSIQITAKPRKPIIIARAAIPRPNTTHTGKTMIDEKHQNGHTDPVSPSHVNGSNGVNGSIIPSDSDESLNLELQTPGKNLIDPGSDDVYVVDLMKKENGLGLGLIDGLFTPLKQPGIFVKTIVKRGAAAQDGRLRVGDRILAVNGTTLIGADYTSAMELIRNAGSHLNFLVEKSDEDTAEKISVSVC